MNEAPNSTFPERMNVLIVKVGGPAELARRADLSRRVIDKYRSGESEPSRDRLVALARAGGVPIGWLATGDGEVGGDESSPTALQALPAEGFVMVPRYNVEASAGHGVLNGHEHVVDYMAFRHDFVRRVLHAEPANLALINAVGDSMEPAIRAGDLLLIDRGIDRIMDDAIYILGMGDELVVKRVQRFFDGGLTIKSDNPTYREQTIPAEATPQLRVAGRVRWIGRLI